MPRSLAEKLIAGAWAALVSRQSDRRGGLRAEEYYLYSGVETVARARGELGKEGYSLAGNNCEHFAVWCKTGLRESAQVNKAIEVLLALCG